jgi:hypothetical protein
MHTCAALHAGVGRPSMPLEMLYDEVLRVHAGLTGAGRAVGGACFTEQPGV